MPQNYKSANPKGSKLFWPDSVVVVLQAFTVLAQVNNIHAALFAAQTFILTSFPLHESIWKGCV